MGRKVEKGRRAEKVGGFLLLVWEGVYVKKKKEEKDSVSFILFRSLTMFQSFEPKN